MSADGAYPLGRNRSLACSVLANPTAELINNLGLYVGGSVAF